MSGFYGSMRAKLERAVASVIVGGATLLVMGGTLAICFGGGQLGA
jgi:hypothetical protein